jgi:transposase
MTHYAGLDVSVRTTSVCIVTEAGQVVRETRIPTEPAAIFAALTAAGVPFHRIGLEAGPLSQWLFGAMIEAGLPAICVETRHMKAALAAQVNKTDRNDARGIAQMMRVGLYRPVHVKTRSSQEKRTLLTSRKLLQDQIRVLENHIRGSLRTFGLKVGLTSAGGFEGRVRELIETYPSLSTIMAPLLAVRDTLRAQFAVLHRKLLTHVRSDPICTRLMSVPGVGPIVALTFQATIDQPQRFARSKAV